MSTLLDKVNTNSPLATMAAAPAAPLFLASRTSLPVTSTATPTITATVTPCDINCTGEGDPGQDTPETDMSS